MIASLVSRLPYLLAVALVAAALGDPLVESLSNSGVFGLRAADNNHQSVIPALLAGVAFFLEVAALRCAALWRGARAPAGRDWLVDVAARFARRPFLADVPLVVALQFVALFGMERVEHVLGGGPALGAFAWLGGPAAFSVIAHVLLGSACTFVLGWSMRALLATFARRVARALASARAIGRAEVPLARRPHAPRYRRARSPHHREALGRAPPLHVTPA